MKAAFPSPHDEFLALQSIAQYGAYSDSGMPMGDYMGYGAPPQE